MDKVQKMLLATMFALLFGLGPAARAEDLSKCPDGSEPKSYTLDRQPVCGEKPLAKPAGDDSRFTQRTVKIGTVTYRLPDNWVFINAKCAENDADCRKKAETFLSGYKDASGGEYKFLNNQNWLQCLSDCPGGSTSSGIDLDYCMQTPSCLKDIEGTLAKAQAEAKSSSDPANAAEKGIADGNKEAASFLNDFIGPPEPPKVAVDDRLSMKSTGDGPATRENPPTAAGRGAGKDAGGKTLWTGPGIGSGPSSGDERTARRGGGPAGDGWDGRGGDGGRKSVRNPGMDYGLFGDGGDEADAASISGLMVDNSPFLRDRALLAKNVTDLRRLRQDPALIRAISSQLSDSADEGVSGRRAFDGESADMKKTDPVRKKECLFNNCQ